MPCEPRISFVLATRNRRDVLMGTLRRLTALNSECGGSEAVVVDNGSRDGTADAVRGAGPGVSLIRLCRNLGSCAKAIGAARARGRYVVFLDDDSYPRPGSIAAMLAHFATHARLGAAGFAVHLPDGRRECSALPNVFVGCGVGFRRDVLRRVGGLDRTLFMQAEEYDLSFRLVAAGYTTRTFDDLHVEHLKTPRARIGRRTVFFDTRNNLIVAARYLPGPYERIYRQDWLQRYRWIAENAGHPSAFERGRLAGMQRWASERRAYAARRLSATAMEQLFRVGEIERRTANLADAGVGRILLADLGKNIFPFVRAAQRCGLGITAIADDRFASNRRHYRGIPICETPRALAEGADAIVIANTSPVHASATRSRLATTTNLPIHGWFCEGEQTSAGAQPPELRRSSRHTSVAASKLTPPVTSTTRQGCSSLT